MAGIFLFIWYSDVQYASIFILWCGQRKFKVALVFTSTYCELLTCISVVVSMVGRVKGTKMRSRLRYLLRFVTCINVVVLCVCGGRKGNIKLLHLSLKVPPPVF